jgi:hypothetical protein
LSSAETLSCAACGSQEPAGSAFCGNCGSSLATPPPQPEPTVETSPATEGPRIVTCANCGNEEPDGSEFCGNCGAALSATTVLAPEEPDAWPRPERPAPQPQAPFAPAPRTSPRWRSRPVVFSALGVLVVAVALAVVFGTGAIGGSSGLPQSAFLRQVNTGALRPLRQAIEGAAQDANSGSTRADGTRIVDVASGGANYLRVLHGLTGSQREEVRLLLAYLAANAQYGQALGAFNADDARTRLALDSALRTVGATRTRLPTGVELAAHESYISSQSFPPPPPPPPPSSTTASASAYVDQVDELLRQSHGVVVSLGSWVPQAARDKISRGEAVADARSYLNQRRLELAQAQRLQVPDDFAEAQSLLVRSLEASVADDQALIAWAVARRDDSGTAKAAFTEANRLGARATTLKRRFLRVYGLLRQQATGHPSRTLPAFF